MSLQTYIELKSIPAALATYLDIRDVVLWIANEDAGLESLRVLCDLPWNKVVSEVNSPEFLASLRKQEDLADPMVRRRGFKHVVFDNPVELNLPPRSLPFLIMNGNPAKTVTAFAARARRTEMLVDISKSAVQALVILGQPSRQIENDLVDLWGEGFRPTIYLVSDAPDGARLLEVLAEQPSPKSHGFLAFAPGRFAQSFAMEYSSQRRDTQILRLRSDREGTVRLDVTALEDPQNPLLSKYETIFDNELTPLRETDLQRDEIDAFFRDARTSWRPFAAGLPYMGVSDAPKSLVSQLKSMEREKANILPVKYISSSKGSGATTLLRAICWTAAQEGFPVLIARDAPFEPDAESVAAYILRVNSLLQETTGSIVLYELPWVIAFDQGVWEGNEDALTTFAKKLETLGRQVVILVATGPFLPVAFYKTRRYQELASLDHILGQAVAEDLGRHMNRYLEPIGAGKSLDQWRGFLHDSTEHSDGSKASFWVTLSFWLQGRFQLQETFDTWVYRQFKEQITEPDMIEAVLNMAALAAERVALPQLLLPSTRDYPVAHKLRDSQAEAPALGIIFVKRNLETFCTILHQSVAEAIVNQFFYDAELRKQYGFEDASSPAHLRLILLRRIASDERLSQRQLRVFAERFATHIFKIDRLAGHSRFVVYWREALDALDQMPDTFRRANRVFLHHSAVSRRRVASDPDFFPIDDSERAEILKRAIQDINLALSIPEADSNEPDLNLLNSLARGYYDLAEVQITLGELSAAVRVTQQLASDATAQAFRLNPDNSYVTETYVKNLLVEGKNNPDSLARTTLEVLTRVYSVLERDDSYERRRSLTRLADEAFDLLLAAETTTSGGGGGKDAIEAIQFALRPLGTYENRFEGMELTDYPSELRMAAAEKLAAPILQDNPQAVKLRYILTCIDRPKDFALQLELLTSLGDIEGIVTPQMRLENAILLYQNGRHHEGSLMFQKLRSLWREKVAFVSVPARLHWLIEPSSGQRRQVHAMVRAIGDNRYFADVEEFEGEQVPFRPREFQGVASRPRDKFSAHITFGHNGAFLRPLSVT